jgi:hypothetical protein
MYLLKLSYFVYYAIGKSGYPAREMQYLLELAAQCCRALRNLSVNRKCYTILYHVYILLYVPVVVLKYNECYIMSSKQCLIS